MRVFFFEGRALFSQTSARQMFHPEDRRSSTGVAFFCAAAAYSWCHYDLDCKHSENKIGICVRSEQIPRRVHLRDVRRAHSQAQSSFQRVSTRVSSIVYALSSSWNSPSVSRVFFNVREITLLEHDLHEYHECDTAVYRGTPDKLYALHI